MFAAINRSVRRKFMAVVLATTLIALLVAAAAMLTYDAREYRRSWVNDLRTQAEILALASAPALAFDDREAARENLSTLRVRAPILAAAIYREDGRLFASFTREGAVAPPAVLPAGEGQRVEGDQLMVLHPIIQNSQTLGTVYLRARYELLARVANYLGILTLVLIGSLTVALIVSARLQTALIKPLLGMADVARQIGKRGDYALRAKRTSDDEIGLVVDAFNDMLGEVQSHAAALESADRHKDEFLATLAHELRNPLAPIRQAAKISRSDNATEAQKRWSHDVISRQVEHMSLLLDDLLDISRITRGRLELRKEWVDLRGIVDAALETAQPSLDAHHHRLALSLPDRPLFLEADPLRLAQVLANLLTNAAKYTEPNCAIRLSVRCEERQMVLQIVDSGIGIEADMLPRIFEMFSQAKSAIDRAEGGLGIGLALVKGLVTLHGGSVEAVSEGLGRGSTFTVRLPLGTGPAGQPTEQTAGE